MKEFVKILVAVDDIMMRNILLKLLEKESYNVTLSSSFDDMKRELNSGKFDLLLLDYKLINTTGGEPHGPVSINNPEYSTIIFAGLADIQSAKDIVSKGGAQGIITKPLCGSELSITVERAFKELFESRSGRGASVKVPG